MIFTITGGLFSSKRQPNQLLRAMKLTMILLIAACLHVSATGFGQKVSISGKDLPLEKVFTMIKKQTGYVFFYDYSIFQGAKNVTLDLKDVEIDEAMRACLRGQGLEFSITNKTISIVKKNTPPPTQTTDPKTPPEVKGVVRADNGIPLVGATVFIRKLNKSGATDTEGEFILHDVPNGKYTVEISYIGYDKYVTEIVVENHEVRITAEMKVATNNLDATVVKGYYNTTKRLNTGNVSTVKGDDIQKQPVTDPILALEGRVPGLYIQQTSGVPGAYSTIRLRGQNSIANGNDPLYIIDGVPYSSTSLTSADIGGGVLGAPPGNGLGMSPFNSLNPSDIESIEVLKDADATAIYGSRGANGVILISTRKGKPGNTKFDLNVFTGAGKVSRMLDLLNTSQYLQMRHEAYQNDGVSAIRANDYDINGVWDTTRYTNWQKVLIGNAAQLTNAQASISGGDANTQFLIGAGYSKQGTVYPGDFSDRKASVHVNVTHVSSDHRFHVQFNTSYVNDNSNMPQSDFTSRVTLAPDAPAIYDANGNLNWQIKNGRNTWANPLASTLLQAKATTDNLISSLNLSYLILPGLQIKSSLAYNHNQMNQSILTPASSIAPPNNNNPDFRSNSFGNTDFKTWIIEPQIAYQKKISKGVLDVLVGTTFQQNIQNSIGQYASGFGSDELISNPLAASTFLLFGKEYSEYHYNAVFSRLSFNWKEKYLLNVTARRDGSSRFGPDKQFGNFGAIGAGWVFSKEKLVQDNLSILSFGKLRASYGTTGNDQITDYQYLSTYTSLSQTYQGITGLYPTSISNPHFGWEMVRKLEGGIELGFLNDRIFLTTSYYRNRTDNQLVGYGLPVVTGFSYIQANLPAVIQNAGTEFTLSTVNIKRKDFEWNSSVNLSIPTNKLIAYPDIKNSTYNYTYSVGQSLFIRYLYHYTGVNAQTGAYTFATKNANGIPSGPQDYIVTKPVTQKFYGGFQNTFNYKGFQLDIFFQFVKQLGYNYIYYFNFPGISNQNMPNTVLARWKTPGDNSNVQRYTIGPPSQAFTAYRNLQSSDAIISDASFIRLKNLSLAYQLPNGFEKRMHLKTAKIYFQCQNLFTITNYLGLDPETGGLNLPPLRMITGGIQVAL